MVERRNVLIVSCTPFYGGGEIFIKRVVPYFKKYNVYVYLKSNKLNTEIQKSITFFYPNTTFIQDIQHVNKIIKEYHISLVILNGNRAIYLAPFLPLHIKIIAYKHTGSSSVVKRKRFAYKVLNYVCLLRSNQIICVSKAIDNDIPFFTKKKKVVYNGLPLDCFPVLLRDEHGVFNIPDVLNFIFVGRIEHSKGIWETIKSIEKYDGKCRLYILGEGDQEQNVRCYLNDKNIQNIKMLGQVDNVGEFLEKSHIFILPSYYEAFGFSIIEAMAYSLPVISTNVGAIPEIVRHGIDGMLVPPHDVDSLFQAITYLSSNNDARYTMGRNARKRVEECFMLNSSIRKIQEIIDQNIK